MGGWVGDWVGRNEGMMGEGMMICQLEEENEYEWGVGGWDGAVLTGMTTTEETYLVIA